MGIIVVGVIVLLVAGLKQAIEYKDPVQIATMIFFIFTFLIFIYVATLGG